MSTLTEGTVVGDIILQERELNGSREELLMDESQTLVLGTVCRDGAGGRKVALTAKTNEVHTLAFTGFNAGFVKLGFTHPITGVVEWTADVSDALSAANIQTLVDGLAIVVTADDIKVTGSTIDDAIFTYSGGDWTGRPVPLVQIDFGDAFAVASIVSITRTTKGGGAGGAAANEVQTFTWDATATGGTFTVTAKDSSGDEQTSGDITYDDSDADGQAFLDAAFGADQIIFTSLSTTVLVLTYSGAGMAGVDHDLATIDVSSLTSVSSSTGVETTKGRPGGTQEANSICIKAATTAGSALTTKTVFLTNTAVVNEDQLDFGDGDKDAAIRELNDVHKIMMRKQPTTTETQTS